MIETHSHSRTDRLQSEFQLRCERFSLQPNHAEIQPEGLLNRDAAVDKFVRM